MNSYFYLKAQSYPHGTFAVITRGSAHTDEEAVALAQKDEIVVRQVDGTAAYREDQESIDRQRQYEERLAAEAKALGITVEEVRERNTQEMYRRNPELAAVLPAPTTNAPAINGEAPPEPPAGAEPDIDIPLLDPGDIPL